MQHLLTDIKIVKNFSLFINFSLIHLRNSFLGNELFRSSNFIFMSNAVSAILAKSVRFKNNKTYTFNFLDGTNNIRMSMLYGIQYHLLYS